MYIGFILEEQNFFSRESYALLVFAQELFIKALLLENGEKIGGHHINKLFEKLELSTKANIMENVDISELDVIDKDGNTVETLITFDDYIKYESNYFVNLRYDYEKIDINEVTTVPRHFINNLTFELYRECCARFSNYLVNLDGK